MKKYQITILSLGLIATSLVVGVLVWGWKYEPQVIQYFRYISQPINANKNTEVATTIISGILMHDNGDPIQEIIPIYLIKASKMSELKFEYNLEDNDDISIKEYQTDRVGGLIKFFSNQDGSFEHDTPNGEYYILFKEPWLPEETGSIGKITLEGEEKYYEIKLINNEFNPDAVEPIDTSDWLTYRNENFNYKLRYPKEWRITYRGTHPTGEGIKDSAIILSSVNTNDPEYVSIYITAKENISNKSAKDILLEIPFIERDLIKVKETYEEFKINNIDSVRYRGFFDEYKYILKSGRHKYEISPFDLGDINVFNQYIYEIITTFELLF